jgi:hypothetical protein
MIAADPVAVPVAVPVVLGLLPTLMAAAKSLGRLGRAGRESLMMRRSRRPSLPG